MELIPSLQQYFGFDQFRAGQEQVVQQLLAGNSSLAIFPTGSGKSLCYQLAALHLPHLTLVVSPLLALMKDQLGFLRSKGINAASIDSTLSYEEHQGVVQGLNNGEIKILMVSVERFKNERFRQLIHRLPISMLVVDEAHCVSEWGHNFRPDYLKLPTYAKELNIPLTLLLTATATKQVKQDMAERFAIALEHIVQTGFYRQNLDLSVVACVEEQKQAQLLKVVAEQQQQLSGQNSCGVVYVTLQQSAEQVASFLIQQGINAKAYHAGLDNEVRSDIQQRFMAGEIQVVVATIAFGMGVDKSDIRFVIHYDLPKSIENYSQEIGRAGRDGQPSNCIVLANLDGLTVLENFVYGDTPEQTGIEHVLNDIREEQEHGNWSLQLHRLSTASNIKQLPLKTLLVQLELAGVLQASYSYFAEVKFKFVSTAQEIVAMFAGERQQFLQTVFDYSAGKKVWYQPDFDAISHHSGSDRKRILTALEYLADKGLIVIETKQVTDVYRVNQQALNNEGLAGYLADYFASNESKEIARLSRLVAFFNSADCLTAQLARYFDDNQAPDQCGHCSVCRGQVANLTLSTQSMWPEDNVIKAAANELVAHLSNKVDQPISITTISRFLAGMTVPIFGRHKVKSLSGFGLCQQLPYAEVKQKLNHLLST
ncbi:RecQ family ATP-dependent DNA helicase [Thalassotalea euphylliae]|uniref:ATP-dependent DNA helicase RecQ n=1 Tax=Thalassotalea euphylliae TaxID=1655234 RepID=A0A3E0TM69_9GAMM|nr:RecQ family ATP-dependent DNA helicase [Thalassotalea euphylliae]REL25370.1 RecQ family ATP-dependent DNA helicase [Thalassotalea euphylliae]